MAEMFEEIKIGDKVIGHDRCWYNLDKKYFLLLVTKVTKTRFTTSNGSTFLKKNGDSYGTVINGITQAIPTTEELEKTAKEQLDARRKEFQRKKLIKSCQDKLAEFSKNTLPNLSNTDIEVLSDVIHIFQSEEYTTLINSISQQIGANHGKPE
jgi:hypothetical protein